MSASDAGVELPAEERVNDHLRARRLQLLAKRLFDVTLSLGLLLVLSPVLVVAGLLVRLDSRGPAMFAQERWGLDGRPFVCYKFRSMYVEGGSPVALEAVAAHQQGGRLVKMKCDPRVTRVGRWIRKTSIDELPQLWNVLKGDMSLVGPRPLMIHMLEPYPEIRALRNKVRPGITGLWQVSDRESNTHVYDMVEYDMAYLQRLSLGLDAMILVRTVRVVLSGSGAV